MPERGWQESSFDQSADLIRQPMEAVFIWNEPAYLRAIWVPISKLVWPEEAVIARPPAAARPFGTRSRMAGDWLRLKERRCR